MISIHALRGEGDSHAPFGAKDISVISIHALRGEGDTLTFYQSFRNKKRFQSTPSVGRATAERAILTSEIIFQSTPSVGRATHSARGARIGNGISIHALRGEGDHLL